MIRNAAASDCFRQESRALRPAFSLPASAVPGEPGHVAALRIDKEKLALLETE